MVEQHDPTNIEAIFYSSYGKARMAMVESDRFKREQKIKVLKNSISVIDDNYDSSPEKYDENKKLIEQINNDIMLLVMGSFVYTKTTTQYGTYNDSEYTYTMFIQLCLGWIESLENIIKIIPDPVNTEYILKLIRMNYVYIAQHSNLYLKKQMLAKIEETDSRIKRIDPTFSPTVLSEASRKLQREQEEKVKKLIPFYIIGSIIAGGVYLLIMYLLFNK